MKADSLKQYSPLSHCEITDQSRQIVLKTEQCQLIIKLMADDCLSFQMFISLPHLSVYTYTLRNHALPPDVAYAFENVEMLFQCLKYPFEVLLEVPAIRARAQYIFKSKKIIKEATIKLFKQSLTKEELLDRKIMYIRSHLRALELQTQDRNHWQPVTQSHTNVKIETGNDILAEETGVERILKISKTASEKMCAVIEQFEELQQKTVGLTRQIWQTCENNSSLFTEISCFKPPVQSIEPQTPFEIIRGDGPEIEELVEQQKEKVVCIPKVSAMPALVRKPGLENFLICDLTIMHTGPEKQGGHQVILDYGMKINTAHNRYKLRVDKTEESNIYIGIIYSAFINTEHTNEVIAYCGIDGEIWDSHQGKKLGPGFKQGDVVEVQISHGEVQWKVNKFAAVKHKTTKLKNSSKVFYPLIEMVTTGDCVQWVPL